MTPYTEDEITKIISEVNNDKATGSSSIPLKIFNLAKKPISNHLPKIFNLFFSSGVFSERLKTVKVTPIFKKVSKLECSNYRPILFLSNLDKMIEELIHKRVKKFLS